MLMLRTIARQTKEVADYPVASQYSVRELEFSINYAIDMHHALSFETSDGRTIILDPERYSSMSVVDLDEMPDSQL